MCVIIRFLPGQTISKEHLQNAVWNNWHGFGLVVKEGEKGPLKIIRKVAPEDGEVDYEEIADLLTKYHESERILHLRHTTAGTNSIKNCHPFDILYVPKTKRQVVFMHNGTMMEYKSKKYVAGTIQDDDSGPSDTANYVEQVLIPIISGTNLGDGCGDINHLLMRKVLDKLWPFGNRGILIANDQAPLFLGEWKKLGNGDNQLQVSNDDYFTTVKRGPENARREKAAAKNKPVGSNTGGTKFFHNLKNYNFESKHDFYKLSESPCNLLNDWEFYDRANCVSVGYFKRAELEEMYTHKNDFLAMAEWALADYALLYKEYMELEEKHQKATKKISCMVEELRALSKGEKMRKVG